jgi:hypothetical protein
LVKTMVAGIFGLALTRRKRIAHLVTPSSRPTSDVNQRFWAIG